MKKPVRVPSLLLWIPLVPASRAGVTVDGSISPVLPNNWTHGDWTLDTDIWVGYFQTPGWMTVTGTSTVSSRTGVIGIVSGGNWVEVSDGGKWFVTGGSGHQRSDGRLPTAAQCDC